MRRMLVLAAAALIGCGEAAAPTGPSGTLYLSGREPGTLIRVDTATGAVTTRTGLRQMGGGDPPYFVYFTGGRLVTFALGRDHAFAPDLTHPKSLGESWFFVPSATPGRVWNLLLRKGDPATVVRFRGVREVAVDGTPTLTRRWAVPGWPVGAVEDGLVLQRERLEVWDPVTRKRVRTLPGQFPIAMRGRMVAACADDPCDTVHLNERPVRGPFAPPYAGAFSPGGTLLAVTASHRRIAVIEVATGKLYLIPGARTDGVYSQKAWASSGWLFWNAGGGAIGAWRPGEPARRLPVRVGPFIGMTSD